MSSNLIPLQSTADRYGVTRATVYRWLKGDTVKNFPAAIKIGKSVFFDAEELAAWESAQREKRGAR